MIARVHPEILRSEALPDEQAEDGAVWQARYKSILDLERHLERNGTRIIKVFLHLSKDEQRKRSTSTAASPWYIVAADDKENARLIVSRIIVETLATLRMSYPKLSEARLGELRSIRKSLAK